VPKTTKLPANLAAQAALKGKKRTLFSDLHKAGEKA